MGITVVEPLGDPALLLWPDTVDAVELFERLSTQWQYAGMGVPVGLNYQPASFLLSDVMRVDREQWPDVFNDLQLMETHALSVTQKGR